VIEPSFVPRAAAEYRKVGGAWAEPSLDERLGPDPDVARVAGGLRATGVRPGDVVVWQSPNRDEVRLAYRACWRIGAIAAPIHHLLGPLEVESLTDRLNPALALDLDDLPRGEPVTTPWLDSESLAAVLFTSGSSGTPKGVLHSQATLAAKATTMRLVHDIGPDDVVLMPAPCAHISGLLNGVTLPGVARARTVFMAKWDPVTALDLIERERVTFMVGPPTFFVSMMDSEEFSSDRVASLRLISCGGAGVSATFVERARRAFSARVKRTYGSTEAPTVATSWATDSTDRDATHDGRAVGDVELTVSSSGELLVRGPEVCLGYLDPNETAAAFDEQDWFHTGDLATIDDAGWLTIVGRMHDVIIRGGENISAAEVESILMTHPDVRSAAVVAVADDRLGERVRAVVTIAAGRSFDTVACQVWFRECGVARYKTPEIVDVVEALPMLPTGKPDKAALRGTETP
jgi:acyl-CoA synthetase (AMP-forming)/AMP-acid ligase II